MRIPQRTQKYACGFALPAAWLDDLVDQPPSTEEAIYSFFSFFLINSAP